MQKTVLAKFRRIVEGHKDSTALAFLDSGKYKEINYQELDQYRSKLAGWLKQQGWQKGEKFALMIGNGPEWIMADLAAASLGLVIVPVHTTYNAEYIRKIVKHAEAKYLIITSELFVKHEVVISSLDLQQIVIVGQHTIQGANVVTWPDLDSVSSHIGVEEEVLDNDLHTIIYTSGTTGDPKGVMLSHKNLMSNADSAKSNVAITAEDRFFSFLPLSHAFERMAGYYAPITTGASIYFAQSTKTIVEDIKLAKPTIMSSVPRIFERIYGKVFDNIENGSKFKKKLFFKGLQLAVLRRKDLLKFWQWGQWKLLDMVVLKKVRHVLGGNLRLAISGGASLDLKVIKFFDNLGIKIIEGYGMTETAPIIAVNKIDDYRYGTVGFPVTCNEVMIDEHKEILVRGDNVMLGYYNNQEATKETIDSDNWLHTGDLGFIDREGFLTIVGRAKDVIILSTGKNIFPEQIENVLNESRYIIQSMIYGDKEKHISALIVPNFDQIKRWCVKHQLPYDLSSEKILNFYKDKVEGRLKNFAKVEQIDHFTLIDEEFSQENGLLTPTLKLKRKKVLSKYT
jgi:long-chain acyl-CoA synthetase